MCNNYHMKTIIAGGRDITDYQLVLDAIKESQFAISTVVCGGAKGVDTLGERYATDPTKLTTRDFAYVHDHEVLRGRSEVHGVFIGSFRNRKDLEEIVFMIRIINKIPQGVQILPCEI
jgi:hypothetical protein